MWKLPKGLKQRQGPTPSLHYIRRLYRLNNATSWCMMDNYRGNICLWHLTRLRKNNSSTQQFFHKLKESKMFIFNIRLEENGFHIGEIECKLWTELNRNIKNVRYHSNLIGLLPSIWNDVTFSGLHVSFFFFFLILCYCSHLWTVIFWYIVYWGNTFQIFFWLISFSNRQTISWELWIMNGFSRTLEL